jgi:hypothetical protein
VPYAAPTRPHLRTNAVRTARYPRRPFIVYDVHSDVGPATFAERVTFLVPAPQQYPGGGQGDAFAVEANDEYENRLAEMVVDASTR